VALSQTDEKVIHERFRALKYGRKASNKAIRNNLIDFASRLGSDEHEIRRILYICGVAE